MAAVPHRRRVDQAALIALPFAAALAGGLREPAWAAGGLLALWALAALAPSRPKASAAGPWLALAAWIAFAAAASPEPLVSAPAAARAACAALVFAFARLLNQDEADLWTVGFVASGLIAALAAAVTGGLAFVRGGDAQSVANSMTGLIPPYYNYTAFVEAGAAAAAFACAMAPGAEPKARRSWGLAAALLALPLLVARSRGGELGFLVAGGLVLARAGGKRAWLALALMALGAAGTVALKAGRPNQVRPRIWRAATQIASERPLLGEGPDRFEAGFARHNFPSGLSIGRYQMTTPRAHSEPLEAAATAGWPGAVLFLSAALGPLALALRRPRASAAREAALAAAAAMTAQLFVDNMLHLPGLALLYASALGAAAPAAAGAGRALTTRARLAFAAAALACLAAFVPAAALSEGRKRLDAGLPAAARERLAREALRLSPRDGGWHEALGESLLEQGRVEDAAPELLRALELRPFRPFPAYDLAAARARQGRWDEARELCGRALAAEPDYLNARLLRARALLAAGRKGDARAELAEARRRRAALAANAPSWTTAYDRALVAWDAAAEVGLSGKIR